MLSRVADSLYWMSRYIERAENTVRQLDVTMGLMLDTGGASAETRWERLVASLGKPAGLEWNGDLEAMARRLVFDNLNHAAITFCVNGAREKPARYAKRSPPSSGSALIGSSIRFIQRRRRLSSRPASTTR